MKAAEIQKLSGEDLQAKLKEARAELFNLRFQMATGQLDNTARIKPVSYTHLGAHGAMPSMWRHGIP